jgi:branched-chain amino acid transport system substrate-binding protein
LDISLLWGLEDVIAAYTALWNAIPTNKIVGGLFPNDADGNAWGDPDLGFPRPLKTLGFSLVDPGRYQPMAADFSAQIAAFKKAGVEIVTGVMIPPDFATFWTQAAQQGFKPKIVTIGKALLFPSAVSALGSRGDGLSSEVWWSPSHPFTSSLTGQSAKALCEAYTSATGRPWTQPIGFSHALYEVAFNVLKRAKSPNDPRAIVEAIAATKLDTIVGSVDWSSGPVKNVSKTPLVAGQWTKTPSGFDLTIVENKTAANIPVGGALHPLA